MWILLPLNSNLKVMRSEGSLTKEREKMLKRVKGFSQKSLWIKNGVEPGCEVFASFILHFFFLDLLSSSEIVSLLLHVVVIRIARYFKFLIFLHSSMVTTCALTCNQTNQVWCVEIEIEWKFSDFVLSSFFAQVWSSDLNSGVLWLPPIYTHVFERGDESLSPH